MHRSFAKGYFKAGEPDCWQPALHTCTGNGQRGRQSTKDTDLQAPCLDVGADAPGAEELHSSGGGRRNVLNAESIK